MISFNLDKNLFLNVQSKITIIMPRVSLVLFFVLINVNFYFTQSKQLESFINDPILKNASVSFCMTELESNRVFLQHNADQALVPASVLKLVSTSTALNLLGPEFKFETTLYHSGSIENGILKGDLIIRGGGDPSLGNDKYNKDPSSFIKNWVEILKKKGVNRIEGNIIGDGTLFDQPSLPGTTSVADIGNYYGSGVHALAIYDNMYTIHFTSENLDGGKTEVKYIQPDIPYLELKNEVKASNVNRDNAYIHSIPDSKLQIIKGTIPKNQQEFVIKGSIPRPDLLAAYELKRILEEEEITLNGLAVSAFEIPDYRFDKSNLKELAITYSPSLDLLVRETNLRSINPYANNLYATSASKISNSKNLYGFENAIQKYWSDNFGIDHSGWFQEDGSGLSRANGISAKKLTQILLSMEGESYNALLGSLKNLAGNSNIKVKSGYMNRVRSYSGYITRADGSKYAFAIIVNNYDASATAMRKRIENFLISIL